MVSKAFDLGVLQGIARDTTPDVAARMIEAFLEHCDQSRDGLVAAFETPNLEKARRLAHALKSSCLATGAIALAELCAEIEQLQEIPSQEASMLYQTKIVGSCRDAVQELTRARPLFRA